MPSKKIVSLLGAFTLIGATGAFTPASACSLSYIVLPDGSCLDVSYLSAIGDANEQAELTYQEFSSQYRRMATRYVNDFDAPEYRQWALDFGTRTTNDRLDTGTAPELEAALEAAAVAAINRDAVEDFYWPLHLLTLTIVGETYGQNLSTTEPF